MTSLLPVSITLTRYREPDWLLAETLDSLAALEGVTGEVLFLEQNWDDDFAAAVEARSTENIRFQCLPCEEKGLSYARNRGIALAQHDIVLLIDADAVAEPSWAYEMARAARDENAAIIGSRIVPKWRGRPPLLAKSKVVMDQYSMLDWGEETVCVNRVVGAGFGVNRAAMDASMTFDETFGRRNGILFNGAESEFCRRVRAHGGKIVYAGRAVVHHQVLPERLGWGWVMRRLYFAGAGRRQQGGAPSPSKKPGLWDWLFLPFILPPYALGYLRATTAKTIKRAA